MADFPSNIPASYPIEETHSEPEVLISRHRDGSEQRRYKGAGRKRVVMVPYGAETYPLTLAQRNAVLSHYDGQLGKTTSFNWTHPETGEVLLVRYDEAPSFRLIGYDSYVGTLKFQVVTA